MNFYPHIISWPRVLQRDRRWTWELYARTLSGGRTLSGVTPAARLDGGGMWMASLGDVQVSTPDQVRAWRALAARLDSGATPVVLEARDENFAPWPLDANGQPVTAQSEATNSDNSTCDDGTSYVSDVISAETYAAADLRATTLRLRLNNASALKGGEHFSIQHDTFSHRLYRIGKVLNLGSSGGNDAFTKVLLALTADFADTNAGGSAHTWTPAGNAAIVGGAAVFDGTGDFSSAPDHADFNLASGDWAIDGEFFCEAAGGTTRRIAGQSDSTPTATTISFGIERNSSNVINAFVCQGSSFFTCTGTTQFTDALNIGWNHVAFVRTGNVLKLFLRGKQEGSDTAFSGAVNNSANALSVGRLGEVASNEWLGGLRRFRLSVGTARWAANFTPPQLPYDTKPGNVYELAIRPPLREAAVIATRAEFDYPKCVMKLASPDAMDLALERRIYGQADVKLVEDFPPFNLVEGEG